MTISKNKGIFSSPVLDGKEDSPSPFWCSKKPFARLVFLCYFEGTVPSGVQTPAPLKMLPPGGISLHSGSIRSANSGSIEARNFWIKCVIPSVPSGVQTPAPLKQSRLFHIFSFGVVPSGVQTPAPLKLSDVTGYILNCLFHPECKLRLH